MYTIILALYVFVCILLIIAVLLQNSKSSDLGAALGGGSGEMFGPKTPSSIMNKITTVIAAAFLVLSLILATMSGLGEKSIMQRSNAVVPQVPSTMNTPAETAPIAPAQNSAPVTAPSTTPAE